MTRLRHITYSDEGVILKIAIEIIKIGDGLVSKLIIADVLV
jgi:hypothetical protein